MIVSTHGVVGSQIVQIVYDADAQAFFDRVTTAGGSLSLTEKSAVNQLVVDMKDDGIWTKMKAIYPMVGASAAACSQNLKSSSFTGAFTATGWTFASTGVTSNGTSAYMNTNFIPNVQVSNGDSLSFGGYVYAQDNSFINILWGTGNASRYVNEIIPRYNNQLYVAYGTDWGSLATNNDEKGFWLVKKPSSGTSTEAWKNGNLFHTATGGSQQNQLSNVAMDLNSRRGSVFAKITVSFAFLGDIKLTNTDASNFYTAVQSFQTTLSRQV